MDYPRSLPNFAREASGDSGRCNYAGIAFNDYNISDINKLVTALFSLLDKHCRKNLA